MIGRRHFLKGTALAAAVPLFPRAAAANSVSGPPAARMVDTVDRRFGLVLRDPYRWMENAQDPD